MHTQLLLPLLGCLSLTLARSLLVRQDSACTNGGSFYCCANDPTQYGGDACFTDTNPCDSDSIYQYSYCCSETDGATDYSTCYNPNAPPPDTSVGNACAPGQNLECCDGDPETQTGDEFVCSIQAHRCDPNSEFPSAYCCDQENGFTQFYTCKPAGNNGASS